LSYYNNIKDAHPINNVCRKKIFSFSFECFKKLTLLQKCALVISCSSILYFALLEEVNFRFSIIIFSSLTIAGIIFLAVSFIFLKKIFIPASFLFIFILSVLYLVAVNTPFSYPRGKFLNARMKIITNPRVEGRAISFTSKIFRVKEERRDFFYHPSFKVLTKIPQSGNHVERGYILEIRGIFIDFSTLGSKTYAVYLKSSGLSAVFEGLSDGLKVVKKPSVFSIKGISNRLKRYIWKVNDRLLPWPHSTFATALITGMREEIPLNIQDRFIKSGTMHILAVSGLHVGFLIFIFGFVLQSMGLGMTIKYLALGGILIFYMLFVGSSASVIRASIMALCGIALLLLDRDRNYLNVLSIAFLILWLLNPLSMRNPGFLLSFTATFAILFVVPYFVLFFKQYLPDFLSISVSLSLGIQVYIIPVMLYFFGSFPYINIVANIPVVPLTGLSLSLEILYLLFYPIFLPLSIIIAEVNTFVITLIIMLADFFGRAPLLKYSGFPLWGIPSYLFFITVSIIVLSKKR